ncbi:pseudouridine synthase [Marinomonas sp. IMCC 4694]|uniref:pseudouridine synthase n=1 Tax=Marinomonas sp. IMCC 4694 TaxID=2605432 RepID=UPI0011E723EC|nr:pseudouridine synthase [Marinomonas sp. IMCC 4694]TYL47613.1 pseudouridine synthase [Marinomonas sp. IMCC 4694]
MRLDKYVCKSTDLNKRDALACIRAGQISVNDVIITESATQVHENNLIELNGQRLITRPFRYIMLHKTAGTVCSNKDETYPSIFSGLDVQKAEELHIAGRLDADTTGLVLITDDGRWSYNLTHPNNACRKVYRVTLSRPLCTERAGIIKARFLQGILLQGETVPTLPADLTLITPTEVLLSITEGRFHQVKRMFSAVGNRVVGLHREQVGSIRLDIKKGQWRYLGANEIQLTHAHSDRWGTQAHQIRKI